MATKPSKPLATRPMPQARASAIAQSVRQAATGPDRAAERQHDAFNEAVQREFDRTHKPGGA
jgi:hypothetical protein